LFDKGNIPKSDEEINEMTEEGKFLMQNESLFEMAHTELILSIGVRSSSGKVVFRIIKECKSRDYTDEYSAPHRLVISSRRNLVLFQTLR
jgi:hypothetical protein